ncbi:MAG TPA: thiamine diphosphokinase, partial [Herpetosiphonaceae bacterium]
LLIAADGGARHLLAIGAAPQVLIGDLDSVAPEALAALAGRCEILRFPAEKNETDLELALLLAAERGATEIRVLAALGGRPDMHLANQLLLALPALAGRDVALLADGWSVRLVRSTLALRGAPGRRVSLVPLGDARGVRTEGLRYPLRGEPLLLGPARGVSNEFEGAEALVSLEAGALLVFAEDGPI